MLFTKARLKDVWLLDLDRRTDERGFFARVFCAEEFSERGLVTSFPQMNTLRRMIAGRSPVALPMMRGVNTVSWITCTTRNTPAVNSKEFIMLELCSTARRMAKSAAGTKPIA